MKQKKIIWLGVMGMLVFAACGEKENPVTADTLAGSVESVAEDMVQDTQALTGNVETVSGTIGVEYDTTDTAIAETAPEDGNTDPDSPYDVDLTQMSNTMVYAEVYNMMMTPEDYVGKTINMDGVFSTYYDQNEDQYYHACVIQDATACCAQGIEFVLKGNPQFPEGYPEQGDLITVSGIFELYEEDGFTYCRLTEAELAS
ncbi:MAG: hypothetical protein IJV50_08780 [Lachnospiraceae bacterium]|nr:hypothetical protein [Lachnospiraceae bacterium]